MVLSIVFRHEKSKGKKKVNNSRSLPHQTQTRIKAQSSFVSLKVLNGMQILVQSAELCKVQVENHQRNINIGGSQQLVIMLMLMRALITAGLHFSPSGAREHGHHMDATTTHIICIHLDHSVPCHGGYVVRYALGGRSRTTQIFKKL